LPNPYFAFKQFTVYHDACAMKVGTDGCLLGAWADAQSPKHILDIGAGTGLVALMLAQRFENAKIIAVEIENKCAAQCEENISNSPWANRIETMNCAIQEFTTNQTFDLIVCNPPFFSNDFAAPNPERHTARHDDSLSASELFIAVKKLLTETGVFTVIIPVDRIENFIAAAQSQSLFVQRKTTVKPTPSKAAKRFLLSFGQNHSEIEEREIFVESSRGIYSEDFRSLLADFYLNL